MHLRRGCERSSFVAARSAAAAGARASAGAGCDAGGVLGCELANSAWRPCLLEEVLWLGGAGSEALAAAEAAGTGVI